MTTVRSAAGRLVFWAFLLGALPAYSQANGEFPFDKELLLDVPQMRPVKRVPILNVGADGAATIDLWCQTVSARVTISGESMRIEPAPVPDTPPAMMVPGQCTPERVALDTSLLADLAQIETWKRENDRVVLAGPTTLRFRLSTH